jgi:hypothetical protein
MVLEDHQRHLWHSLLISLRSGEHHSQNASCHCTLIDSRLLVSQLLWCVDGSSLVGAVSYRPRVSSSRSAKQRSSRHLKICSAHPASGGPYFLAAYLNFGCHRYDLLTKLAQNDQDLGRDSYRSNTAHRNHRLIPLRP